MSFILDALKKSETDRQRQTGPALFEVKVAPPKARFPVWAVAIVALLVINMIIVGWLLLRRTSRGDEAAAQATSPAPAAANQPAPTAAANGGTLSPSVTTLPPPTNNNPQQLNSQQANAPPPTSPEEGPPASALSRSLGNTPRMAGEPPPVRLPNRDQNEPTLAGRAGAAGADSGGGANPDDYEPATDPGDSIFKGHVKRGTASGLMLYQDLAVANGSNLPELRLDLHVYNPKPQDRFALVNMQRVHEGDMLKGEVRVEAITPDGVVLSHVGMKFLLPRE